MRRAPRARRVVVEARAKLNLALAVGPARADGFHELATLFQSVSLADTLVAEPRRRGFSLCVRFEDASVARGAGRGGARRGIAARAGRLRRRAPASGAAVPAGPSNLVLRAARRVAARAGLEGGARFTLLKRIPARAGLGGGSADAAAALAALDALYGLRLGRARRLALAAELGSDVPFAVHGGTALGLGRGERLTRLALERPFRCVIVVPAWRVATAAAFREIDRTKYGLTRWRGNLRVAHDIGRKRVNPLRAMRLGNTFEEVLGGRRPDFERLRAGILAAGAADARMTGSGSALFGILDAATSTSDFAGRFAGSGALFFARSARAGLRVRKWP